MILSSLVLVGPENMDDLLYVPLVCEDGTKNNLQSNRICVIRVHFGNPTLKAVGYSFQKTVDI